MRYQSFWEIYTLFSRKMDDAQNGSSTVNGFLHKKENVCVYYRLRKGRELDISSERSFHNVRQADTKDKHGFLHYAALLLINSDSVWNEKFRKFFIT